MLRKLSLEDLAYYTSTCFYKTIYIVFEDNIFSTSIANYPLFETTAGEFCMVI
jgi:hypothetical protein